MDPGDWSTVRNDTSLSTEVPATMWAELETPIAVRVRRKSGPALTAGGVTKVALKVDVNDLAPGQTWRGLKKLSLESGAEISVLREGFAWNMFRLASEQGVYGYPAGHASWVRVVVNGEFQGVYVNAEQRDKQFLENRGMFKAGATWLYKVDGNNTIEAGVTNTNSPTFEHLCYSPFVAGPGSGQPCAQPNLDTDVPQWVDLQGMLALAAINAFCGNGDSLFTHDNKNSFASDYLPPQMLKRRYFPWDLDTGLSSSTFNIYTGPRGATQFQTHILGHYWFRQVYRHIMSDLVDGPLSTAELTRFLDALEPVLAPALAEDPNAENDFADVRQWVSSRVANVRTQVGLVPGRPRFTPAECEIIPGAQVALSHTNAAGTIYFTLDGTDPRALGGSPAGAAYTAPLTLTNTTHIRARAREGTNWSALREATFNVAGHAAALKVTEIMYHPRDAATNGDGQEYEFIELKNTGPAPVNLSGCYFDGIGFQFAPGAAVAPGALVVLVRNAVAFAARYPGVPFHGVYWGGLDKNGEKLRLKNSTGNNILSVEYNNRPPWPVGADGFGWSLVNANSAGNPDDPANWRASAAVHGSPGADDPPPLHGPGVVINELLAHSENPFEDAIELFNPTAQPVDLGGWFLSDDFDSTNKIAAPRLKKFRIPDGTVLSAGGYRVFYEWEFNGALSPTRFALSRFGETVYLSSADTNGNLTGCVIGAEFHAADSNVPLGRHVTSTGVEFTPLAAPTFGVSSPTDRAHFQTGLGAANTGPRPGPVVISEVHYNPGSNGTEFVELQNLAANDVDVGGWKIEGTGHTFAPGTIIEAGDFLVLCGTTNLTAEQFRASNNVPAAVPVVCHAFTLQNDGESLRLVKPNVPATNAPIFVDRVRFNNNAPWPTEADGAGFSLQRRPAGAFGNDPAHWRTGLPATSPGRTNVFTNHVAIARGSTWKYNLLGCDLGSAWRAPAYVDSSWRSGRAPLGDGLPALRTLLTNVPGVPRPVTTWFRKVFVVNDPASAIISLRLAASYDDGFIAHLNGAEIARRSLPAGPVNGDTPATAHASGSFETIDLSAHIPLLDRGRNVLAVELHQAAVNDTALAWDAELLYELAAAPAPTLAISGWRADEGARLVLHSTPGVSYTIQFSTNLPAWHDLTNLTATGGTIEFLDMSATNVSHRFYRALAP